MADWAAYMGVEAVVLDSSTTIRDLKRDLALGRLIYR